MKATPYILLAALAIAGSACERTLDFEGPKAETENDMVINAIAVADGRLAVYVNRAYLVNKTPSQYFDYDHAVLSKDDITTDYISPFYSQRTAIVNASVTAVVNGQDTYPLLLDADELYYTTDYVPRENDHIVLTASLNNKETHLETVVPAKPHIEVVDYEVRAENPYADMNGLVNLTDTIMRLTCRIKDTGGEHYYRLRVRSESLYKEKSMSSTYQNGQWVRQSYYTYLMQDIYFSEDDLFVDHRLTKNFGGWPAFFSNIFDNSLVKNGEYTFTVDSPKAMMNYRYLADVTTTEQPDIPPRVMVELQAISPEFYHYLKSVQIYRVTETDAYSEPVQIYSNADSGWGILGSLSYDRHYVEF